MSASQPQKVPGLLHWLNENAFWNSELLEVRKSQYGGVGVFWSLGPDQDPEGDNLLLRIPKQSVLSPKNSFIYPLMVDYLSATSDFDFTEGMHSLVLTYIYEEAAKEKSPWHLYLESIPINSNSIPICLWSAREKDLLFNSECDILGMLDASELATFYLECVTFAKKFQLLVAIPELLKSSQVEESSLQEALLKFGACVQNVISRAFTVDRFYGLSLVPGADLFDHLSPLVENGLYQSRENVHFVCDNNDDLCGICGENGCDHLEARSDSENGEAFENEDYEGEENTADESDSENQVEASNAAYSDIQSDHNGETNLTQENSKGLPESEELTMALVEELENGETETDLDDEEVSTLSLSGGEDDVVEADGASSFTESQSELAMQLRDSSKCCDIVLTKPAEEKYNYELFNTYGNKLSNSYLLQRYGFICAENPNLTCNLSIPMFAYLKKERTVAEKKKQLKAKLDWYEEVGFELVTEFCGELLSHDYLDHGEHDHGDNCCKEELEPEELADSWQLSPKIGSDGKPSLQTKALVRILTMPFKTFLLELINCQSERKLEKRVLQLVEKDLSNHEKTIIRTWVIERLRRYKIAKFGNTAREKMINTMISDEKKHLLKAASMLQ